MDDIPIEKMGRDEDEPECNVIWWVPPDMGIKIENRVIFVWVASARRHLANDMLLSQFLIQPFLFFL